MTDAGMPVSDPGFRLVRARRREIEVRRARPVGGHGALAVSGLPAERFRFEGFLPRKAGERQARDWPKLAAERRTVVLLESPRRVAVDADRR